jgi:hypothetical protein
VFLYAFVCLLLCFVYVCVSLTIVFCVRVCYVCASTGVFVRNAFATMVCGCVGA